LGMYETQSGLPDEGYWIIRSEDGGKTWTKPLYTGLRVDIPYIVAPISNLPLNAGEKLQIEVELRNYDTSTLKFPPEVLNIKKLYLEIPWIELEKDTDQDGLTDLAEERLLTDPQNPDTDEDGIPDERDSLPLVSMKGTGSPESAMMLAVLKNLAGEKSRDYLKTSASNEVPDKTRVLTTEYTLFIVGNRLHFESLIPASRMIILSPMELEAAKNKYGSFGVIDFSAFMLDSMKNRGYVIWKSSYWGGTIELKRIDGEWTIVKKTEWYS